MYAPLTWPMQLARSVDHETVSDSSWEGTEDLLAQDCRLFYTL